MELSGPSWVVTPVDTQATPVDTSSIPPEVHLALSQRKGFFLTFCFEGRRTEDPNLNVNVN